VTPDAAAAIDHPVTADIKRVLRVPGTLHGGTGLQVTPVPVDGIDALDPLTDAVADVFCGQTIRVEIAETAAGETVRLAGHAVELTPGERVVPEPVGVLLLASDRATKLAEVSVDA